MKNTSSFLLTGLIGAFLVLTSIPSAAQHVPLAPASEKKGHELENLKSNLIGIKNHIDQTRKDLDELERKGFFSTESIQGILKSVRNELRYAEDRINANLPPYRLEDATTARTLATSHAKLVDQMSLGFAQKPVAVRRATVPIIQAFHKVYLENNKKADQFDEYFKYEFSLINSRMKYASDLYRSYFSGLGKVQD